MSWPLERYSASSAQNYDYMNMPSTSKQNLYQPQSLVPYNMLTHPRELLPTQKSQRQPREFSSTFTNASQVREHHMARVELWLCKICNKEFKSKSGLSCHFTVVHVPKKSEAETTAMSPYIQMGPYIPPAPYTPTAPYNPMAPYTTAPYRMNTPSSCNSCNICDKDFSSRSSMLRHVKSVHETAPKPAKTITKSRLSQKNTNVTINVYNAKYNKRQY